MNLHDIIQLAAHYDKIGMHSTAEAFDIVAAYYVEGLKIIQEWEHINVNN